MADNPSAFKHWINGDVVHKMSVALHSVFPSFDKKSFQKLTRKLAPLELKPRVLLIRDGLREHLPQEYPKALKILLQSLKQSSLSGFSLWPYTEFVQAYGLDHFEESMAALNQLTQKFTAEFAVRPFLVLHRERTFAHLLACTEDKNLHLRRWASEGSRPRLPWGVKLHDSISSPHRGLDILEKLKYDDELYVRKSVANHLNDITKDHPELVVKTLRNWQKNCPEIHREKIAWIQKQALRSLIKSGYKPALDLMGYGQEAKVKLGALKLNKRRFILNEKITFELSLTSTSPKTQKIAVDYIIHFQKANKKMSAKVFKLKVLELKAREICLLKKNHSLKPVTTRRHYSGLHKVEIQINGKVMATASWHLTV